MRPVHCLWNPAAARSEQFRTAHLQALGSLPGETSWLGWLTGQEPLPGLDGRVLRIDSPGRDWEVEKALLTAGAGLADPEDPAGRWRRHAAAEVADFQDDPGRIRSSRQWYLGFRSQLRRLAGELPQTRWMQQPEEIETMFDKAACQHLLGAAGVPVPHPLGVVQSYDDLRDRMESARRPRVFLKLCHGSSASGAVALETSGARIQAFTTARMTDEGGETVLHNHRKLSRHDDARDIRRLVDAVCRHRAWAEAWSPKAGWQGRRYDVRVLVVRGRARQVVARLGDGPFTNLQFGARRGSADDLRAHLGQAVYDGLTEAAERAMACFPRSLYGGVDVLLEPVSHRPRVLEVNAFGDLLPGLLHDGLDTFGWQLRELPAHVSATGM